MVTLYEFVYDELNQPESIDLVGLGAGQEEKDNQWLYRMNKGFSKTEGIDSVEDYWLGLENDPVREYDIVGDIFQQDFETDILESEASILVVPKPGIYRPQDGGDESYTRRYQDISGLVNTEIDGVLMREVGKDIDSCNIKAEYKEILENFRDGYKPESGRPIEPDDIANMLAADNTLSPTSINWQPDNSSSEHMILVKEKCKKRSFYSNFSE